MVKKSKKARRAKKAAPEVTAMSFDSWQGVAKWLLEQAQELAAAERKREAPERAAALMWDQQRREGLARVGVYIDRDGEYRWFATGGRVRDGRAGSSGYAPPPVGFATDGIGNRL